MANYDSRWIRKCQSCGESAPYKSPLEYRNDSWRDTKCRKCKSSDLDYGKYAEPQTEQEGEE
jgi:hypothetical protein